MDNKKVLILTVFAVILLVVAIIATSYAFFTVNLSGTGENVINTGTVSLKCNETSFNLTDTSPVTDSKGIAASNNVATCELVSNMDGEMKVGYDIALADVDDLTPNDGLGVKDIKLQIYKSVDNGRTVYLNDTSATNGVFVSDLQNLKGKYDKSILSYKIDSDTVVGNHTTKYYIKAWVSSDSKGKVNTTSVKNVCSDEKYTTESSCKQAGEVWGTKTTATKEAGTFSFKLKVGATQVLE